MNGGVQSRVEELEPNRMRLTVDVDQHDVQHAVEHAANDLAASVKIPGKLPPFVPSAENCLRFCPEHAPCLAWR